MTEEKFRTQMYNLRYKAMMLERMVDRTKNPTKQKELQKDLEETKDQIIQVRHLYMRVKHHNMMNEEKIGGMRK